MVGAGELKCKTIDHPMKTFVICESTSKKPSEPRAQASEPTSSSYIQTIGDDRYVFVPAPGISKIFSYKIGSVKAAPKKVEEKADKPAEKKQEKAKPKGSSSFLKAMEALRLAKADGLL